MGLSVQKSHRPVLLVLAGCLLFAAVIAWRQASSLMERGAPTTVFADEADHFKYGSIGAEVNGYPFAIWKVLPIIFKEELTDGWQGLGLRYEKGYELPIGISVRNFLIDRVGFNCATCHTGTNPVTGDYVLAAPSSGFDIQKYIQFLLSASLSEKFTAENIISARRQIGDEPGFFETLALRYLIVPEIKRRAESAAKTIGWMTKLPAHGPGRTDAGNQWRQTFGILDGTKDLTGVVDFPAVWNQELRVDAWLHWDGNNNSVYERNISAALAGGATEESVDIVSIERVAKWLATLPPPRSPAAIDLALADAGGRLYQASGCNACHDKGGPQFGGVTAIEAIATDPSRFLVFDEELLEKFKSVGYSKAWRFTHYRRSVGYANLALDGLWMRAPYLHNGSVPSVADLLKPPGERPKSFYRGCGKLDLDEALGEICQSGFLFDTGLPGNGANGHLYGTELTAPEKRALIEYLKTK